MKKLNMFRLFVLVLIASLIAFYPVTRSALAAGDQSGYTLTPGKISTTPFTGGLNLWQLEFRGPVEAHIYAPDGSHTGHVSKYVVDREIDPVQYERNEDYNGYQTTFFMPLESDYEVKFNSIGSEFFSYILRKMEHTKITKTVFYNKVPIGPKATGRITVVHATGPGDLYLNLGEAGTVEELISPDHVFDGDPYDDEIPPVTTLQVSTNPEGVIVTFEPKDNEGGCGVRGTVYSFDKETWVLYEDPLVLTAGCQSTLYYFSVDYNDSEEEPQMNKIEACPGQ
jgi:hypothetical protein